MEGISFGVLPEEVIANPQPPTEQVLALGRLLNRICVGGCCRAPLMASITGGEWEPDEDRRRCYGCNCVSDSTDWCPTCDRGRCFYCDRSCSGCGRQNRCGRCRAPLCVKCAADSSDSSSDSSSASSSEGSSKGS